MRKFLYGFIVLTAATAAFGLPKGLSGASVGFGGLLGDASQGFITSEFDFSIPAYLSLGPEVLLAFGGGATTLGGGAELRVYFIPTYNFIVQPHAAFGGGFAHGFTDGEDFNIGYLHFGGGMDFDVPQGPIVPYFDMGALVGISGDGTATAFKLEGGIRFDVW